MIFTGLATQQRDDAWGARLSCAPAWRVQCQPVGVRLDVGLAERDDSTGPRNISLHGIGK
ncbi:protein of unknown function (plasmid) [Cupriavidus taiwanensis]|nr:protein of unknown function [Cupriavidus taiwanensis]